MVITKNRLEIYLDDLTDEVQDSLISLMGDDGNYDVIPLFVLEI